MGNNEAASGRQHIFTPSYEVRQIIVAKGLQAHHSDFVESGNTQLFILNWLNNQLNGFEKHSDSEGGYTNDDQRVHYTIQLVESKDAFRQALETEDVHVVYIGHSRFGRGACFDLYSGRASTHGNQWGNGDFSTDTLVEHFVQDDGLFRLGYPYVPVPLRDMRKHEYHFSPVPVEEGPPSYQDRHPNARRRLHRIQLPVEIEQYILSAYESESGYYFGVGTGGSAHGPETKVLLHADWENTQTHPYDLGTTELRCKVFCHFGCSSAKHYWPIVRRTPYKGWVRPSPPTDRYAYFTRRPSNVYAELYWLQSVLSYPEQNNWDPWWDSLQYAKRNTNRLLRANRHRFRIY